MFFGGKSVYISKKEISYSLSILLLESYNRKINCGFDRYRCVVTNNRQSFDIYDHYLKLNEYIWL